MGVSPGWVGQIEGAGTRALGARVRIIFDYGNDRDRSLDGHARQTRTSPSAPTRQGH
jgi:hypothetical protein